MLVLRVIATGEQFDLHDHVGSYCIGRDQDCSIRLMDATLSQRHALIKRGNGGWVLRDLDSTNGTRLNDRPVTEALLSSGDCLRCGDCELAVTRLEHDAADGETRLYERPSFQTSSEDTLLRSNEGLSPSLVGAPGAGARFQPGRPAGIARWFPPVEWLRGYRVGDLARDTAAGLTTAALLIPQGLAYAALAGLPPEVGLYASLAPLVLYALFGTCRQMSVGPSTLDSLLVASIVSSFSLAGSQDYIVTAASLALLAGAIQLGLGLLKAGFLVNFLSSPVICGFAAAAALLTALSQMPALLGISVAAGGNVWQTSWGVLQGIGSTSGITLAVAAVAIGLFLLGKWLRAFWLPLLIMVVGVVVARELDLGGRGVDLVGIVASGLPRPSLPGLDLDLLVALLPGALTLALVGYMQSITLAKRMSTKYRYRIDPDQEMRALGLANLASGMTQGYSVTGGLSRTLVNANAGAKTPISSVVAAVAVAAVLVWAAQYFEHLPRVLLAALIITSVLSLVDVAEIRRIFRVRRAEGGLLLLTFAATLVLGIQTDLLLGIGASILLFIVLNTRPNAAVLGRVPGTDIYRSIDNYPDGETVPGVVVLRIDASYYFANCEFIRDKLREIVRRQAPLAIVLEASAINDLDSSADAELHQILDELEQAGIALFVANVKGPVRAVMMRSGLYERLGSDRFFFTVAGAVERALRTTRSTSVMEPAR